MCHPKPQMPSVELGFSGFSRRNVERRRRIFTAYLKVNHSFYHFDFLQDFIPHWQSWTENICLWLTALMLRFVPAASSCLGGIGKRWPCCSRCLCPGPGVFLPSFYDECCSAPSIPQYDCPGSAEGLLFAALQPAFYSQLCNLSPQLLW